MRSRCIVLGVLAALIAAPVAAQTGTPPTLANVRGKIVTLDGQTLTVKARGGKTVPVKLADDFRVLTVTKIKLADIKQGDFVGAAASPDKSGKLHAREVLVFPEAMRGTGEGHYPWDYKQGETMTNATVAEVVGQPKGRTLKLKFKGGEKEIDVPPKATVVTFAPGDRSLLKPGAVVFARGAQGPDGQITARGVTVGNKGVNPPM